MTQSGHRPACWPLVQLQKLMGHVYEWVFHEFLGPVTPSQRCGPFPLERGPAAEFSPISQTPRILDQRPM